MRSKLIALMLLAVAVTAPALAEEPVFAGGWLSTVPYPGKAIQQSFVFEVSGSTLNGSLHLPYGAFPIADGKVEGDTLSFVVTVENDGVSTQYRYSGKLIPLSEVGLKNKEIRIVQNGGDQGELEYPAFKAEMNMTGG